MTNDRTAAEVQGNISVMPRRVQLSRAKGWRMPPNTVKVDRSTRWGNPFVVGKDGTRAECLDLFERLLAGYVCLTKGDPAVQKKYLGMVLRDRAKLAGRNLACWCPLDKPCHGDYLLALVNANLGVDTEPFEVTYTTTGKSRRQTRNVVGVLCPTVLAQRMGLARPIFVDLGDVQVDWNAPQTAGYQAMFDDTPNVKLSGRTRSA